MTSAPEVLSLSRSLAWLAAAACLLPGPAALAVPPVWKDLGVSNTIIIRDFNSAGAAPVTYSGGGAPTETNSGGTSTFSYTLDASDPMIIFTSPAGTFDFATFNWARMRYRGSTGPQVWENSAVTGQHISGGSSPSTFVEMRGDPANPNPVGSGYRIDPVGSVTSTTPYNFYLDYLMADRTQTIGLGEWDADGDVAGASGANWSASQTTGLAASGGVLSGTSSGGDPTLTLGMGFDASVYGIVEIRMRASSGTSAEMFWAQNGSFVGAQREGLGTQDNAFHVYTIDFSKESTWAGTNMRLRLDPATTTGQTFEVDYVRVSQVPVGYWDADGSTSAATGGSGTWSTTTTNRTWRGEQSTTAGGGLPTYWVSSPYDDAVFAGAAGTVTISGGVTANDLSFQTSDYVVTGDTLTLAGVAPQITVDAGRAQVQSVIAGTSGLTKLGAGVLELSGASTYSGGTTVSAGALLATNSTGSAAGTGTVIVASGALLGGSGSVSGAVTMNGGVSPGSDGSSANFGIGVLRTGTITFSSTSTTSVFEIAANGYQSTTQTLNGDATPNTAYLASPANRAAGANDRLEAQGTLNLSEAGALQIVFADSYTPSYGNAFDLLDWTGVNMTSFNYGSIGVLRSGGTAENAGFDLALPDLDSANSGLFYNLDLFLSQGVIVVVPEPGRATLLLGGLLALMLQRRKRRGE